MRHLMAPAGLLTLAFAAGCGGHGTSPALAIAGISSSTTAGLNSGTVANPNSSSLALTDVHGALVRVAHVSSGDPVLAFLPDGASDALEINDAAALEAAGAMAGRTLTASGTLDTNVSGSSALTEVVGMVGFELDDLAFTATVELPGNGSLRLVNVHNGDSYDILGPMAASLPNQANAVVRATGRFDPSYSGKAPGLVVTSWHETAVVELNVVGGLVGLDDSFKVDDVAGTGSYRYRFSLLMNGDAWGGDGFLDAADQAALEALVVAADLHSQPARFAPPPGTPPVMDVPTTYLRYLDSTGESQIQIEFGSTPPAEVTDLQAALRAMGDVPTARSIDNGEASGIRTAGVEVISDDVAWMDLYIRHMPLTGIPVTPPVIDFTTNRVVAVFRGEYTGTEGIRVSRLERVGDELHLETDDTVALPGVPTPQTISPFDFVVIPADGTIYVDGVRLP